MSAAVDLNRLDGPNDGSRRTVVRIPTRGGASNSGGGQLGSQLYVSGLSRMRRLPPETGIGRDDVRMALLLDLFRPPEEWDMEEMGRGDGYRRVRFRSLEWEGLEGDDVSYQNDVADHVPVYPALWRAPAAERDASEIPRSGSRVGNTANRSQEDWSRAWNGFWERFNDTMADIHGL